MPGSPPVLDIVHLGLGPDGHTASLVPGDSVLDVTDADVALTGVYQGRRRMTLTYPILNRARRVLWVVTGSDKAGPLAKLLKGDGVDSRRPRASGPGPDPRRSGRRRIRLNSLDEEVCTGVQTDVAPDGWEQQRGRHEND